MIFGINTTSDISELFYIISRAARRVKFGAILKYHKWYLCQISRTIHAIIIELFCVGEKIGFEVLDFGPAQVQILSQVNVLSQYFGFPNFPLSS